MPSCWQILRRISHKVNSKWSFDLCPNAPVTWLEDSSKTKVFWKAKAVNGRDTKHRQRLKINQRNLCCWLPLSTPTLDSRLFIVFASPKKGKKEKTSAAYGLLKSRFLSSNKRIIYVFLSQFFLASRFLYITDVHYQQIGVMNSQFQFVCLSPLVWDVERRWSRAIYIYMFMSGDFSHFVNSLKTALGLRSIGNKFSGIN